MPIILRYRAYRLLFFSNAGSPREPVHVHVRRGAARAKFWLEPGLSLASAYGMSPSELKELEGVVRDNSALIKERWDEHFGE